MSKKCDGKFTIESWNEAENEQWQGGKISRTLATKKFTGNVEGTAELEAVMLRVEGDTGVMAYVGIERMSVTMDGRTGTFVLLHNAEAEGEQRSATWKILPGSGTGDFQGISGTAGITPTHEFTMDYELPE